MNDAMIDQLANLFRFTAKNHHEAFIETDGEDADWAIWYAEKMHNRIVGQFEFTVSKAELVDCLLKADLEHRARASDKDWPEFYAQMLLEHLAPTSVGTDKLSLYYFDSCPFCKMVLAVIDDLDVDIELRNIFDDTQHRDDLVSARGRATVPVLLIEGADKTSRWMPESRDISRYLQTTFG
ncbi:Glutaredoxin [Octadecabacter temperatus]|uniref:Glutaredoxin 2 n=1 Tax=Octadecabacter temperatus TaxID=1458307 RepID=A0A0K0Y6Y3_9RHOB|nr:glutaredoxin [Octadecabacter temperatus]AKS46709.1 glutaredoxin 2 [Octadecabacter temperatus]SIO19716.1 Glutaredoxin [Octadecabacter temperatus]